MADPNNKNCQVVVSTTARAAYNMETIMGDEAHLQSDVGNPVIGNENEEIGWVCDDAHGIEDDLIRYNLV